MYADDTNLTVCSDSINNNLEEALHSEMKNIHQWLLSNKLTLNIEKTEYMIIGTCQRLVYHAGETIETGLFQKDFRCTD